MWLTPSFIHPSVLVVQLQDGPVQFPLQLQFPHTHWPWSGPNKNNNTWVKRVGGSWKIKKDPNKASLSPESFLLNKERCRSFFTSMGQSKNLTLPQGSQPQTFHFCGWTLEQIKKERRKKINAPRGTPGVRRAKLLSVRWSISNTTYSYLHRSDQCLDLKDNPCCYIHSIYR